MFTGWVGGICNGVTGGLEVVGPDYNHVSDDMAHSTSEGERNSEITRL
uniref:Uncharacterized protein n=1 Tax=Arundo donax TaxID=35708 RepID=A0A0A9FA47_ARUDO